VLNQGFQAITGKAVAQSTKGLASAAVAVLVQWQVALVLITVGPAMAVLIRKLGKRVKKASRGAMRGRAGLLFRTNEVLSGFRVVKVYSTESREASHFDKQNRTVVKEVLRERTARALASPLIEVIAVIILGTLAVIASKAIIDGSLDPARFFGAMTGLAMAGASLKPLTGVIQNIQAAEAASKRIDHLFALEPEKPGESSLPDLPRHEQSIEFEDVTFAYESAREPAVSEVSLRIEHGQTVAFVGPNGCGKTTLLSLVPRLFEPTSGRLLVDGEPVAERSLASLRTQIGVVTQETVIFRGTVAENIAYSRPDSTREIVEKAARLAHAEGFISELPEGYDTQLGDQGLTLSGGQRQRLSIARAILRDPSILILDEATSMIDAKSESEIAAAIEDFSRGRTTLIVAHRLSTVLGADRIVVMAGGRVIETGTHEALLESCDLYRELASHQLAPDTSNRASAPSSSTSTETSAT
jgi:subfamily B ATP-binding cassette protein MsbA